MTARKTDRSAIGLGDRIVSAVDRALRYDRTCRYVEILPHDLIDPDALSVHWTDPVHFDIATFAEADTDTPIRARPQVVWRASIVWFGGRRCVDLQTKGAYP